MMSLKSSMSLSRNIPLFQMPEIPLTHKFSGRSQRTLFLGSGTLYSPVARQGTRRIPAKLQDPRKQAASVHL